MSTIITKFSDYTVQSIEYFIDQIETGLGYRDLPGLFNDKIQKINVTKEHPIATLLASQLSEVRNADPLQSGLIPAISVTPGSMFENQWTMAKGFQTKQVDSDDITAYNAFLSQTQKERNENVLITETQINSILGAYRRYSGLLFEESHQWYKDEEIIISCWTLIPDMDIILGNILDSIITGIVTGIAGDNSLIKNMQHKVVKGLTNMQFGRVLFGTEYNLTFTNTFNNYTIFVDDTKITSGILTGDKIISGEEA